MTERTGQMPAWNLALRFFLGDPSRSGRAPVAVPGVVRLAVELLVLFGGAAGFFFGGAKIVGATLAGLIVVHLIFSGQRLAWLVSR